MAQRTEEDFLDWLSGVTFGVGQDRYGMYGGQFVAAADYDIEEADELVGELAGGDLDAFDARDKLEALQARGAAWIASGASPSEAIRQVEEQMRRYYFDVLNG